jgi:hypothetical protein
MRSSARWLQGHSCVTSLRCTIKEAPSPGGLSARMRPPACSINSLEIARPSPLPDIPLVVKNESKMRGNSATGMPCPVSCTSIRLHDALGPKGTSSTAPEARTSDVGPETTTADARKTSSSASRHCEYGTGLCTRRFAKTFPRIIPESNERPDVRPPTGKSTPGAAIVLSAWSA